MNVTKLLRDLLAKATPGPWKWVEHDGRAATTEGELRSETGRGLYDDPWGLIIEPTGYETEAIRLLVPDAALIVAAVNALPALLSEIERRGDDLGAAAQAVWDASAGHGLCDCPDYQRPYIDAIGRHSPDCDDDPSFRAALDRLAAALNRRQDDPVKETTT